MSIFEFTALVIVLAALFVAWRITRQMKDLSERFERLQSVTYETRVDLREFKEQLESRFSALEVEIKKARGELRIEPTMRLADVYAVDPRSESVLAALHIGGCAHCVVDDSLTIAEAVEQTGADLNRVLAALNSLPDAPRGEAAELRMPNVKFQS